MSRTYKVAVLVGSLRKGSFNKKLAHAIEALAPASLSFEHVSIGELPIYDQDFDALSPQPAAMQAFRDKVASADAVLFVTPEYNRGLPGGLKNAIDVGSRPWGKAVWTGKPAAIVSSSPSGLAAFGASNQLRQSLAFFNMPVMGQPEMYIGHVNTLFAEDGSLAKDDTKAFLKGFGEAFAAFVEKQAG